MDTNVNTDNANVTQTPAADPLAFLDKLYDQQVEWNDKHYKSTTERLLTLLVGCAEARSRLLDDPKLRKEFFTRFKTLPQGLQGKGLSLTSKIVRYVFRIAGNRTSAYARVIDTAFAAEVQPNSLAEWVTRNGGIEAVRRRYKHGQSPTEIMRNCIESATLAFEARDAICVIDRLPQQLHASANNQHDYSLALVRHDRTTGRGEVVYGSTNAGLIKQFMAQVSKQVVVDSKDKAITAKNQTDLAARTAAISGALAATETASELAAA